MKLIRGTETSSQEVDARRIAFARYKEAFPGSTVADIHEWTVKAVIDGMRFGARQAFFRQQGGEK